MKVGIILRILALLALTPGVCLGVTVDLYTDTTIQDGDVYDVLRVRGGSTLDMLAGQVDQLIGYESSTINFYAGSVGSVDIQNASVFNLQGSLFSHVDVYPSARFNVNGGMLEGRIWGSGGQITVNDGTVDIADSRITNDMIMDIYGGVVTFDQMLFDRYAVLNIYGGEVTFERSSGGYAFGLSTTAAFNVYYSDIVYEGGGGEISGYRLRDGNLFMLDQFTEYEIGRMAFVPEPGTLFLLALGATLLRRRK